MDLELTVDQKLVQEMIRDFARKEISPKVKSIEGRGEFPSELLKKLGELGVTGMTIPSEYGGSPADEVSFLLTIEEISYAFPALAVILSVHCSLFCYALVNFGTELQKKTYLPRAAKGQLLGAFSLTEPGAGSDATNLNTKAQPDGQSYVLNGTKSWITTGGDAQAFILFARTEKTQPKLSAFIVERETPGLSVSKIEEKLGLHSSPTAELVLADCRVPVESLLGREGQGASIAFRCLDHSRMGIAAQSVGIAKRSLDEAATYAKQRKAFGKKIAEFQAIQFMIADMATEIEAARLLTLKSAFLHDKGMPFSKESSMAKLYASEAANRIVYKSLQIHGGYGYSKEFFIEQLFRDARALSIYEGTSEIQRLIIARHLLNNTGK